MALITEPPAASDDIEGTIVGAKIVDPTIVDGRIIGGRIIGGRIIGGGVINTKFSGARLAAGRQNGREPFHSEIIVALAFIMAIILVYVVRLR
jgi:hypothetical protein